MARAWRDAHLIGSGKELAPRNARVNKHLSEGTIPVYIHRTSTIINFLTFTSTIVHSDAACSAEAREDPQHPPLLRQPQQCGAVQQPHGELRDWRLECCSAMLD